MSHVTLLRGNAVHVLPALPAESVHCVRDVAALLGPARLQP